MSYFLPPGWRRANADIADAGKCCRVCGLLVAVGQTIVISVRKDGKRSRWHEACAPRSRAFCLDLAIWKRKQRGKRIFFKRQIRGVA